MVSRKKVKHANRNPIDTQCGSENDEDDGLAKLDKYVDKYMYGETPL